MSSSVLQAETLRLEYPGPIRRVVAIRDLTLGIDAGEFVGLLGPSGSGKSSLLFLLAGLRRPTRGHVLFHGKAWPRDVNRAADLRRAALGLVFSEPFLVPYLTVRENALVQLLPATPARRVTELAEALGIVELLDEVPARLSSGEAQRASVLRALVNAPPVVLADEPTSHLDFETGLQLVTALRGSTRGGSLVVASHDHRMLAAATRLWRLDGGALVADTATEASRPC